MPYNEIAQPVDEVTITDEQKQALLDLYEAEPSLGHALALRRVGVKGTKGQLNTYIQQHQELLDDIDDARGKRIRTELMRRAIDGDEQPIVSGKGEVVGYRTERSDRLLEFAARMYLPEAKALLAQKVGVEVTGSLGGVEVTVEHDFSRLVDKLEQVGLIQRGPATAPDTTPVGLLPPPTD